MDEDFFGAEKTYLFDGLQLDCANSGRVCYVCSWLKDGFVVPTWPEQLIVPKMLSAIGHL